MSIVDALLNAALCRLLAEVLFRLGCPGIVARLSTKPGETALARSSHSQIKRERLQSALSSPSNAPELCELTIKSASTLKRFCIS